MCKLTKISVASISSAGSVAGCSSGSLSESIKADFFFFGTIFSVSLPESLNTCRLRFSTPISDSGDALRLPDFCEGLRERFECAEPLRERFVCGEPDRFDPPKI